MWAWWENLGSGRDFGGNSLLMGKRRLRSEEVESTYLVPRVSLWKAHKDKAVVLRHDYLKLKLWHFLFIRSWLSSSILKSIRYKIVNFDTKLLEGKVKEEPDQGESIKPVSSIHLCIWVLENDWVYGYSASSFLGPSLGNSKWSFSWALRAFWEILVNEMCTQPFGESYANTSPFSSPVNLCKVLLAYSGSQRKEGYIYGWWCNCARYQRLSSLICAVLSEECELWWLFYTSNISFIPYLFQVILLHSTIHH